MDVEVTSRSWYRLFGHRHITKRGPQLGTAKKNGVLRRLAVRVCIIFRALGATSKRCNENYVPLNEHSIASFSHITYNDYMISVEVYPSLPMTWQIPRHIVVLFEELKRNYSAKSRRVRVIADPLSSVLVPDPLPISWSSSWSWLLTVHAPSSHDYSHVG